MIAPQEFIDLGNGVGDELARLSNQFHAKDEQHDGLANAADAVRAKTGEIESLLHLPGSLEQLANSYALTQASPIPPSSSLEEKHQCFQRVYQALDPVVAHILRGAWLGEWDMNDDGLSCKLRMIDRSKQSTNPASPNFEIVYTDSGGRLYHGWVKCIDQRWHHLHFFVSFGDVSRKFDAYLFTWDKCKLAGVTEGKGFCATKMSDIATSIS